MNGTFGPSNGTFHHQRSAPYTSEITAPNGTYGTLGTSSIRRVYARAIRHTHYAHTRVVRIGKVPQVPRYRPTVVSE